MTMMWQIRKNRRIMLPLWILERQPPLPLGLSIHFLTKFLLGRKEVILTPEVAPREIIIAGRGWTPVAVDLDSPTIGLLGVVVETHLAF
jgi:hypothetical protein